MVFLGVHMYFKYFQINTLLTYAISNVNYKCVTCNGFLKSDHANIFPSTLYMLLHM